MLTPAISAVATTAKPDRAEFFIDTLNLLFYHFRGLLNNQSTRFNVKVHLLFLCSACLFFFNQRVK